MSLKVNWNVLWTVVNLLVLTLLLRRFLFLPLRACMARRAQGIADSLDQAEGQKAQARELCSAGRASLDKASIEAKDIVDVARQRGDEEYDRIIAQAKEASRHLINESKNRIEQEALLASQELQGQVAQLALAAARRVMKPVLTEEQDRELLLRLDIDKEWPR